MRIYWKYLVRVTEVKGCKILTPTDSCFMCQHLAFIRHYIWRIYAIEGNVNPTVLAYFYYSSIQSSQQRDLYYSFII